MICAGCGLEKSKASRRHKEKRYCAACYHAYFKKRPCSICGENSRIPIFDKQGICLSCEKAKPCIRCGRHGRLLGKLTKYGPMCKSCRNRDTRKPLNRNKLNIQMGTCVLCHRHRHLTVKESGKKLCKKCFEIGFIRCKNCFNTMPAGRVTLCEQCYWEQLYSKRTSLNASALFGTYLEHKWNSFAIWLKKRRGVRAACLKINSYLSFFLQLLSLGCTIPTYRALLEHFGPEKLRRARTVVTWLVESGELDIDETLKLNTAEKRRIAQLLKTFESAPYLQILINKYHENLKEKLEHKRTSIRSMRLALSTAVIFLNPAYEKKRKPTQEDLNRFIQSKPGQLASITGFINSLNQQLALGIKLPKNKNLSKSYNKKKIEKQLVHLYSKPSPSKEDEIRWIKIGLKYFHDKTIRIASPRNINIIEENNEGYTIRLNNKDYWLPPLNKKGNQKTKKH